MATIDGMEYEARDGEIYESLPERQTNRVAIRDRLNRIRARIENKNAQIDALRAEKDELVLVRDELKALIDATGGE